jgi:hypothetical protein
MPDLQDDKIQPGDFSLDHVSKSAEAKARELALETIPAGYKFSDEVAVYVARRVLEEIGLGKRASVEHHKATTDTGYKIQLMTTLNLADKNRETEAFFEKVEEIIQQAIEPHKQVHRRSGIKIINRQRDANVPAR